METGIEEFVSALAEHAPDFSIQLHAEQIARLARYYELLTKWNGRLHLVAPCSPAEFAVRHVLESLMLLRHLPLGAIVTDVGSGGGLPIVPCLLVRDDLQASLIESSKRKAVFLREVLHGLRPGGRGQVTAARFEDTPSPATEFISCRALDRFAIVISTLMSWAGPQATFLFFCGDELRGRLESMLSRPQVERIPHSDARFLVAGRANSGDDPAPR
ncbi:MAG TPA: RsmG family class I SAM-dependent methyltransferase [Pyrinomonadaceae bacterium]|nr:RsmG family class I SAM-dependent methyltransferase [Pyrinomonadaceae bacterium]